MMSGPPLGRSENSSHLDESGPSQGISGEEARSFWGRASLAQSRQNHRNLSSFFWAEPSRRSPARGLRELLPPATPKPGLDSKDGKHQRPTSLPPNLSRPEIGEVAPAIDLALSSRTKAVQHGPPRGRPTWDVAGFIKKYPSPPARDFLRSDQDDGFGAESCPALVWAGSGRRWSGWCRVGQVRRRVGVGLKFGR